MAPNTAKAGVPRVRVARGRRADVLRQGDDQFRRRRQPLGGLAGRVFLALGAAIAFLFGDTIVEGYRTMFLSGPQV